MIYEFGISERTNIKLSTFHHFGRRDAPILRGNFFILRANVEGLNSGGGWFLNVIQQLTYIKFDGETEGLLTRALFEIGLKIGRSRFQANGFSQWPPNIDPSPQLKRNVGLSYYF